MARGTMRRAMISPALALAVAGVLDLEPLNIRSIRIGPSLGDDPFQVHLLDGTEQRPPVLFEREDLVERPGILRQQLTEKALALGERLGPGSVALTIKHFPGGGPQEGGSDPHYAFGKNQAYPTNGRLPLAIGTTRSDSKRC